MAEVLLTAVGVTAYPGDVTASSNWPGVAPGRSGVNNAFSGKWCDTSAFADLEVKPPVLWLRGDQDQVISDESMFDFGTLGRLEAVPACGSVREVVFDGCGHCPPIERSAELREQFLAHIQGAG